MKIAISAHAINRYQERVKPGLTWTQARAELEKLVEHGKIVKSISWVTASQAPDRVAFLEISDGLALGICYAECPKCDGSGIRKLEKRTIQCRRCKGKGKTKKWIATTVLTRGGTSEHTLARRRNKKAGKRSATRLKRRKAKRNKRPEEDWR